MSAYFARKPRGRVCADSTKPLTERTRVGVKAAQRRGVKFGRTVKLSATQVAHAREQVDSGKTVEEVATLLRVGRSTLYRAFAREVA